MKTKIFTILALLLVAATGAMAQDPMLSVPMTIETTADGPDTITFTNYAEDKVTYEVTYKTGGTDTGEIAAGSVGEIYVSKGDKVTFYGDNATYAVGRMEEKSNINCTGTCKVYGNIMSLVSSTDFATTTELDEVGFNFAGLFVGNTHLTDASGLLLPATTLTEGCYFAMFGLCESLTATPKLPATTLAGACYMSMFQYCASLTEAPELPATTLADWCYIYMFSYCTSLTTAPELPAKTLAYGCYGGMFGNCTSLTAAPELSATTLAEGCYASMFEFCTSLTTAPELPATTLAENCYADMFMGCESLTTAPELPATTLAEECYAGMFMGCTSLTTAPELPATTLAYGCYMSMFKGCSNLSSVTCLATDISARECTNNWLKGVAASGTFTKAASMENWTLDSPSGIPSGWTVEDYVDVPTIDVTTNQAGGAYWSTFYSNKGNYEAPEGTEVFIVKLSGTTLTTAKVADRIVKRNQGVVLKNTKTGNFTMTKTDKAPAGNFKGNSLKGTLDGINGNENGSIYVLNSKESTGVGFYKLDTTGTLAANKAYLEYSDPTAGAREFFALFDEATGIESTHHSPLTTDQYYDLQGRRVKNAAKGVYIVNGRKVVIK